LPSVLPFLTEFSAFNVHIEHCAETSEELRIENIKMKLTNAILKVFIIQRYAKYENYNNELA